jgi:outer membrane translocation and assembly module TamA
MLSRLLAFLCLLLVSRASFAQQATAATRCRFDSQGDSVVSDVALENPSGLTLNQQADVRDALIGRCFDQASSSVLGKVVFDYLQDIGYRQAFVLDPNPRVLNGAFEPHPAVVVIDFQTGPRYRLSAIYISGNRAIAADQLRGLIPITPGDVFETKRVQQAVDAIRSLYVVHGYRDANVLSERRVNPSDHTVMQFFEINEGNIHP